MENPTKSADPVTRQVVYRMIKRLCTEGISIIMTSPDIEELLTVCNRILFLRNGEIKGEFQGEDLSKSSIIDYFSEKRV
jgi:ribose transport system ATP-binding protein